MYLAIFLISSLTSFALFPDEIKYLLIPRVIEQFIFLPAAPPYLGATICIQSVNLGEGENTADENLIFRRHKVIYLIKINNVIIYKLTDVPLIFFFEGEGGEKNGGEFHIGWPKMMTASLFFSSDCTKFH